VKKTRRIENHLTTKLFPGRFWTKTATRNNCALEMHIENKIANCSLCNYKEPCEDLQSTIGLNFGTEKFLNVIFSRI